MLNTSAMVKKAKEGRVAYVEHLCNGQGGKGGTELHMLNTSAMVKKERRTELHMLNTSAMVKKANEDRVA